MRKYYRKSFLFQGSQRFISKTQTCWQCVPVTPARRKQEDQVLKVIILSCVVSSQASQGYMRSCPPLPEKPQRNRGTIHKRDNGKIRLYQNLKTFL